MYRNGLARAVTKNYKLVKLQQECYESTTIPL